MFVVGQPLSLSATSADVIAKVKADLDAASLQLAHVKQRRVEIAQRLPSLEQSIPQNETLVVQLRVLARARVLAAYKNGGGGQLAYLLNPDFFRTQQRIALSNAAARSDAKLAKKLAASLDALRAERDRLKSETTDLVGLTEKSSRLQAVVAANNELGKPYVYASRGPDSFDCSGLVTFVYAQIGVTLTPYSGAQYDETTRIARDELQPGDLIFYGPGGSSHVAIYAGEDIMIAAPHTGDVVKLQTIYGEPSGYGRVDVPVDTTDVVAIAEQAAPVDVAPLPTTTTTTTPVTEPPNIVDQILDPVTSLIP